MSSFVSAVVTVVLAFGLSFGGVPTGTVGDAQPNSGSTGCCKN